MSGKNLRASATLYSSLFIVFNRMPAVFGNRGRDQDDDDDDNSSWWQWMVIPVGGLIVLAIILFVIKRCMLMQAAKKIKKRREQAETSREQIGNPQTLTTAGQGTSVTCYPDSIAFPEPHHLHRQSPYSGRNMTPPPPYTINMGEAPPAYDAPYHPPKFAQPGRHLALGGAPSVHHSAQQIQGGSKSTPQYLPSAPPGQELTTLPDQETSGPSDHPDELY